MSKLYDDEPDDTYSCEINNNLIDRDSDSSNDFEDIDDNKLKNYNKKIITRNNNMNNNV